jgi:hypothetical protein
MEMLSKKEIGNAKVMASTTDAVYFRHANTFERYQDFGPIAGQRSGLLYRLELPQTMPWIPS